MKKLIIIGCGPKAVAIAAKAYVLKKLGWEVPEIIIIDKHGVAANWDGTNGYTDGDTLLGTTPLEDVGFPYSSRVDPSIDKEMLSLSFMAYMVEIGKYAEWVDRALSPPTHRMLADYYKWVINKTKTPIIVGEVTEASFEGEVWSVTYTAQSGSNTIQGEGLVITGPGDSYKFPVSGETQENKHLLNSKDIWHNIDIFKGIKNARIAVIGAGETSAGIVTGLLKVIDDTSSIEIITRHPILFTRNENWMEVMYFSNVMDWNELTNEEKKEIIRHADRGTFSVAAKNLLDAAYNVNTRLGNVERIEVSDEKARVILTGNHKDSSVEYDYVIEATGFDPLTFVKIFHDASFLGDQKSMGDRIQEDLSLAGISPKLHLPGLSAMAQGPGFPNLSCLGLLSERILSPYVKQPHNQ